MRFATPAIVLREYTYEKNRILTLLTRERGVLTAFANRANLPRNPLAGSTELLCYSDFILFQSKTGYVVDEASSIQLFFSIRSRFEDLSLASYFVQLFSELSPKEEPAPEYVSLLLHGLHLLEKEKRPRQLLKPVVELRLLTLSGYMPNLVGCHICGSYSPEKIFFSPSGELTCDGCESSEREGKGIFVPPGVLQALRFIVYSPPEKIFQFRLSSGGLKTLSQITENYLLYQIEKTLPTLEFYRGLINSDSFKE